MPCQDCVSNSFDLIVRNGLVKTGKYSTVANAINILLNYRFALDRYSKVNAALEQQLKENILLTAPFDQVFLVRKERLFNVGTVGIPGFNVRAGKFEYLKSKITIEMRVVFLDSLEISEMVLNPALNASESSSTGSGSWMLMCLLLPESFALSSITAWAVVADPAKKSNMMSSGDEFGAIWMQRSIMGIGFGKSKTFFPSNKALTSRAAFLFPSRSFHSGDGRLVLPSR